MFKSLKEKFKKMEVKVKVKLKKLYELTYNPKTIRLCKIATFVFIMIIMTKDVSAKPTTTTPTTDGGDSGTGGLETITTLIKSWSKGIGTIVAGFGAIQAAFGFKNDDPEAKTKGLKTCASGAMVVAVAEVFTSFAK